ncbi:ParA family protein [Parvularcula marina]|uniref:ParA family protein n=1 Tax=Parvularcula marina TaxID=2292771 RepID=A0A371RFK0_9PROT|nr:division plane positioning ATPase MipZ [Parvularcula marina]RFB04222.1 ParA family protein [Parvularcula marina]
MQNECSVLVFASQKGGSGKTTLSGHIAVAAQAAGAGPVALIDTDPQGSLAKWWNAREAEMPVFVETTVARLSRDIAKLRETGLRLIVIDTPPAATAAISEVVEQGDLIVVPTRPSPHDLRAVGATVDIVEEAGKPLVFAVNCATARARITSETAVSLSQHGTVAPVTIHNRVDFAASMIDGRTVGEVNPNARSAKEVATLWSYLEERLRRIKGDTAGAREAQGERFSVELLTPIAAASSTPSSPQREESLARRPAPIPPSRRPRPTPPPAPAPQAVAPQRPTPRQGPIPLHELFPLETAAMRREPASAGEEPLLLEEEMPRAAIWDGIDRRSQDAGPPPGLPDRRRAPIFGRRPLK